MGRRRPERPCRGGPPCGGQMVGGGRCRARSADVDGGRCRADDTHVAARRYDDAGATQVHVSGAEVIDDEVMMRAPRALVPCGRAGRKTSWTRAVRLARCADDGRCATGDGYRDGRTSLLSLARGRHRRDGWEICGACGASGRDLSIRAARARTGGAGGDDRRGCGLESGAARESGMRHRTPPARYRSGRSAPCRCATARAVVAFDTRDVSDACGSVAAGM